ncbi:MAG: hypothetical protein U1E54_00105 [Candidatus Levybacteria bacterium]|nr:hypothetical protein [Candidatus Levybacteria bacterium]
MAYRIEIKDKAIKLRKDGYSLNEISNLLKIAKSTASDWLSSISLSPSAQNVLKKKQILGQYKSVLLKRMKSDLDKKVNEAKAHERLKSLLFSNDHIKLCCALMWWCEGNKNSSFLRFTSSDVTLIKNYLSLLREGFPLDESKFRVLVHLHAYHNDDTQKRFWSQVTKIPINQFHKSFQKTNTGKRTRENYPGCIALTYYDAKIAKELEALYNEFTKFRGVR